MADVRCPMCGKPNPAESDTCQFCEARLKPLIAGSPADSNSETPDWLSGFRVEQGNEFDDGESVNAEDDSVDWLARLGEAAGGEPSASAGSEEPEWMRGLETTTQPAAALETPDLSAQDFFASSAEDTADQTSEPAGFSAEDWFTETAEDQIETASDSQTPGADFFSEQVDPGLVEGDLPDWLATPIDQAQEPTDADFESKGLFGDKPPSEPGGFFAESEPVLPGSEETTQIDWQAGITPPAAVDFDLTSPQAEQQPADELPDWLNWDAATEKPAASDSPDWQFEMDASQESASTPGEAASARNSDWLSEGSSTTSAESTSPVVSPFSFLEDDDTTAAFGLESDWSAGGLGEPAQAETPTSQPASDEPDWLSSLIAPDSAGPATPFDVGSGEGSFFSGEEADSTTSFFSDWGGAAQEQPDWLSADSGAQATNDQPASVPAFSFDEGGDAATPSSGLPLGAAPDWMSQVEAEDAAAPQLFPGGEEAPQDDESLERAHLPGWLEAMRPVDAIALEDFKDTSDERMETDGPLAGLRGALPVGIETSNLAAAAPHGLKLQISEETNNRVTMLNELLAAETQPRKAASMEFISGALIRLVLFVALMMAAIWALWYGEQPGTVYLKNSPLPPAAADFQQQMSFLPTEPVVLVAVEAEAAFSGEMDAAAEAVITYLAARRAQIVFVSTNTTGPILAEYYVENLNQQAARGSVGYGNYANLGLLPGGPAGLISFLNDPEQTTTLDLAGQPAWGSDSGSPSAGLSNFSAVIVLTANSETARLWIEQAGPLLRERGIPLLFGVSAQVAPILQPYYHAVPRQVDGILSGLPDVYQFASVNALAQLSGQPGEATQLVDAYSAVVMAAVLILLIGIAVNLMSTLLPARSKERKA